MAELSEQQFKALLTEVVGADVSASPPITDRGGLAGLKETLKTVAVRLRSGNAIKISQITEAQWEEVRRFFWGVGNLETISKEFK
jgi:hypothetical protein